MIVIDYNTKISEFVYVSHFQLYVVLWLVRVAKITILYSVFLTIIIH
jgi:hypothetical protein